MKSLSLLCSVNSKKIEKMDAKVLVEKINSAVKIEDIISVANFKEEFKNVIKEIHPDVCAVNGAKDATIKMNEWKNIYENGKVYKDDIGEFTTNGYWADFKSSEKNLNWSVENYRLFKQLNTDTDKHFIKYLPEECKIIEDKKYRYLFNKRSLPVSGLVLSQEHVNWVLNRLLEYCAYLSEINFVHCGLTPESVFIVPETHGIQICSFYHLTRIGSIVKTASAKYKNWYPTELFSTKIALPNIDLEMAKRMAIYLLGEKSGNAVKLRKTHNEDFINFILNNHTNAYKCLTDYKEVLRKNFKKEFHSLTI